MPVLKCPNNNKYRIGNGPCVFDTREIAMKAYRGYLWKKYGTKASQMEFVDMPDNIDLKTLEDTAHLIE